MLRGQKAWILLMTFVLGCAQGVLSLALAGAGKGCCASTACCASQSCPMRPAPVRKSKSCAMPGMDHHSPRMKACSCSLSSGDATLSGVAHSDWRMDLPRAASLRPPGVSRLIKFDFAADLLKGHTVPPDQPPEILS